MSFKENLIKIKKVTPKKLFNFAKSNIEQVYYDHKGIVMPTQCSLYMSELCNFKCTGCRRTVIGHDKKGYLTLDDIKILLKKYPTLRSFTIAGLGEPSLSPHFEEIINYLDSLGKSVLIVTNGTKLKRFVGINNKNIKINISLYGLNEDMYQQYTETRYFDNVISTYKALSKDFTNVGFSYIASKETVKDFPVLLNLMDELAPRFLYLNSYLVYDDKSITEIGKTITDKDPGFIEHIKSVVGDRDYVVLPKYVEEEDNGYYCDSYQKVINLAPDGSISGCRRQVPPSLEYGSIYNDKDPYNSDSMKALREKIKCGGHPHDECKYCFGRFDDKYK